MHMAARSAAGGAPFQKIYRMKGRAGQIRHKPAGYTAPGISIKKRIVPV